MPRERIQHGKLFIWPKDEEVAPGQLPGASGQELYPGMTQPEGTFLLEQTSLDVAWNREAGWVQVGIFAPRDYWERFIESYSGSEQIHFPVWSEVLTRAEINDMIRVLRRARDAAYGADA